MHTTIMTAAPAVDASIDPLGAFCIAVGVVIWLVYSFAAAAERKKDLDELSGKTKKKER